MKGYEESADGSTFVQAMYERMLFGNKAFKELFRALEAGETPILFHCSAGKDRTGVAAMLILLALALRMRRSVRTMSARISAARLRSTQCWRSTPKRSRQTRPAGCAITARRAWTRQPHPLCCAPSAQNTAARELSGSRIRPDPCAPDAAAQDVSGINGNGDGIRCGYCPCFLHKMFCGAGFSS